MGNVDSWEVLDGKEVRGTQRVLLGRDWLHTSVGIPAKGADVPPRQQFSHGDFETKEKAVWS